MTHQEHGDENAEEHHDVVEGGRRVGHQERIVEAHEKTDCQARQQQAVDHLQSRKEPRGVGRTGGREDGRV